MVFSAENWFLIALSSRLSGGELHIIGKGGVVESKIF